MHPLNDIRKGEMLLKQVYEKLRGSAYWEKLMLIIMFDEHGGFYDHIPPPAAVPPGDDNRYKTIFNFDRLGVRVPAIVISPYTVRGTVIGTDPNDPSTLFDHTSTLATVEKRFVLAPLTKRDAAANTVAVALNADTPRLKESEAVMILPIPAPNPVPGKAMSFADVKKTDLSKNQNTMLDLALSVDLKTSDPANHAAIRTRHDNISNENDANAYIKEIESKVISNRKMSKK